MQTASEETFNFNDIIKYSVTEEAIQAMRAECLPLKVTGLDDKKGYDEVKEAKKKVVKVRGLIEKERKALKQYFLDGGKAVDAPAKAIFAAIEPVEDHLQAQLDVIDKEKERLAKVEADRLAAIAEKERLETEAKLQRLAELEAAEVARKEADLQKEREAQAKELAEKDREIKAKQQALEAEIAKQERAAEEKKKAYEKAAQESEDAAAFGLIAAEFPTIELAWAEVVRLRKLVLSLI